MIVVMVMVAEWLVGQNWGWRNGWLDKVGMGVMCMSCMSCVSCRVVGKLISLLLEPRARSSESAKFKCG